VLESKRGSSAVGWAVLIALLIVLAAVGYGLTEMFEAVGGEIAAPLIGGMATVVVSVISVLGSRLWDRRQQRLDAIRQRKLPIYESFVRALLEFLRERPEGEQPAANEAIVKAFQDFSTGLIVWGSSAMLSAWADYLRAWRVAEDEATRRALTGRLDDLLRAIRGEFEHTGESKRGDVLSLFINDADEFFAAP
jgi:hypothetical protein